MRLLFSPPILHRGEARDRLVVQGIVYNPQWILPFRNGKLPSKPPLFAAPELNIDDFVVLAYRLRRQIERRPIRCAKRNDYYLTDIDQTAVGELRILVSTETGKIALVEALGKKLSTEAKNC